MTGVQTCALPISQGINNKVLGSANTSSNELWQCRASVSDGTGSSNNITSSSVSIGNSFVAPTINWTNATSVTTGISSTVTTPTNNNDNVNLSVTFHDDNTNENHTVYFCKTNSATSNGCEGGEWCNSNTGDAMITSLSCLASTSALLSETYTYYAFITDNNSLVSTSTSGTFNVNHPPLVASITGPANHSWSNTNNQTFTASSTDTDGDMINYTFYCANATQPRIRVQSNRSDTYAYTFLNETEYYCAVTAMDQHGYAATANSTTLWIRVDYTRPSVTSPSIDPTSFTTDTTTNISFTCTDALSGMSTGIFTVLDVIGDPANQTATNTSSLYSKTYVPSSVAGTYTVSTIYCTDKAGNTNAYTYGETFTTTSPATGGSGTGGGSTYIYNAPTNTTNIIQTGCVSLNNICEAGEDPLNCPEDCKAFDLDEILCLPIPECGNWKRSEERRVGKECRSRWSPYH